MKTITESFTEAEAAAWSAEQTLLQVAQSPEASAAERVVAGICAASARELCETLDQLRARAGVVGLERGFVSQPGPVPIFRAEMRETGGGFDEHGRWTGPMRDCLFCGCKSPTNSRWNGTWCSEACRSSSLAEFEGLK